MSDTYINCSWCKKPYCAKRITHATDEMVSFTMKFEYELCAVDAGCSAWGFYIEGLCRSCAHKLYGELTRLGIDVKEIDY